MITVDGEPLAALRFVARESGRLLDDSSMPDEIAVSIVTVGELRAGLLAANDARD